MPTPTGKPSNTTPYTARPKYIDSLKAIIHDFISTGDDDHFIPYKVDQAYS
jgi:hypothetical protein